MDINMKMKMKMNHPTIPIHSSALPVDNPQLKLNNRISEEEAQIRAELAIHVEKDLENEIKAQICRLATRLHNLLYQHQNTHPISPTNNNTYLLKRHMKNKDDSNTNKVVSEMKISIKMDGGTKVAEIKELNKLVNKKKKKQLGPRIIYPLHYDKHIKRVSISNYGANKFDWTNTLRSSAPPPNSTALQQHGKRKTRSKAI